MSSGPIGDEWLPDAHWGTAVTPLPDWRLEPEDTTPDDDEPRPTPPDVIAMLGFDPALEPDAAE